MTVAPLIQDQLSVIASVKDQEQNVARVADMGATWHELFQVYVDERSLPIFLDKLQLCIEVVEVGYWI